jgi:hypothetical protein
MDFILPTLFFILTIPLSVCGLIALFAALMLLLPDPIRQARENLTAHPWRSILLGFLNFAGAGIVFTMLVSLTVILMSGNQGYEYALGQIFQGLMVIIVIGLAIPIVIGLSAAIMLTGIRIGEARKPYLTYLRSGILLLLACLVPFIGWFVFTPLLISASLGSVVGLLKRPKKALIIDTIEQTEALEQEQIPQKV